ncbi:hypothetical protein LguiA_012470 [Lonicera macranthoides]
MELKFSKQVLQDNNTTDPSSITSLTLTHKALSDVSSLRDFKNLERLDLAFNNLSSLEGLKSCLNLKWLSVVQNKLQSLKGIEGLTKLTVLNAGKNTLRSVDEVQSLVSLRALILNDNEIASVCRLDQMKELNTLVLSRNPIRQIGESLVKVKSITKLSLSNCQLQTIDSSLKSCSELRELRLAHNDIKTLPVELAQNTKLQNLDLGNNLITRSSDLKVLLSMVNLRNLNLQGNPIAETDKLAKKIKKLVPNIQIYNARPIDKPTKNETSGRVEDSSPNAENEQKLKKKKRDELSNEKASENKVKKKLKLVQEDGNRVIDSGETPDIDPDLQKELKRKKQTKNELSKEKASDNKRDSISTMKEKEIKKKPKRVNQNVVALIDDGETPFMDFFTDENVKNSGEKKMDGEFIQDDNNMTGGSVTMPVKKKKKIKNRGMGSAALQALMPTAEVGLGGPSSWDED